MVPKLYPAVYPTWADLMKWYYDVPIRNYGVPGYSMQGLKRLVYTTAQQDDTVIVMGQPQPHGLRS